jgi:predicted glutamine amidotransferase
MHNGGVAGFSGIRDQLQDHIQCPAVRAVVKGGTDSELLGAVFMHHAAGSAVCDANRVYSLRMLQEAMVNTLDDLESLRSLNARACVTGDSLNLAVTDGEHVVAIRFRSCSVEDPPSLYFALGQRWGGDSDGSNGEMIHPLQWAVNLTSLEGVVEAEPPVLVVASEPLSPSQKGAWHLMAKDQMISYEVRTGRMELHCLTTACTEDMRHRCEAQGLGPCNPNEWIRADQDGLGAAAPIRSGREEL